MTTNKTVWPIDKLIPWDKNPRAIDKKDFERLKKQLTKHEQYKPLLVNQDGVVLGGNMRYQAMKELGMTEAWVSVVDATTEKEMIEYALSDNDRVGYYEEERLAELVMDVDIDFDTYKVDLGQLTDLRTLLDKFGPEAQEDDFDVEEALPEEPVSKRGDIYMLGSHRLMCGDATNFGDVSELMDNHLADMVFTDPPYNVDYVGKSKDALTIQNDSMTDEAFYQFLHDSFINMATALKQGGSIYVCHADLEGLSFRKAFVAAGFDLKQCIIWNKNVFVLGRQDYQWKHEPILYGWKQGASHQFYGDRKQTTVWDVDRPTRNEDHPTMKPLGLVDIAVKNSSKQGDIILDLFGGSGSTLMACEQTQRICCMMELDPRYIDVIIARWEKFTGQKAEKL